MTEIRTTLVHGGGPGVLSRASVGAGAGSIAVGAQDGTVKLIRADDLTEIASLDQNTEPVSAIVFHPKGDWFACALGQTVAICKASQQQLDSKIQLTLDGYLFRSISDINDLDISRNGELIAIATGESDIKLVDTKSRSQCHLASGHNAPVRSVSFSADCRWLASIGTDGRLLIWPIPTGESGSITSNADASSRRLRPDHDAGLLCRSTSSSRTGGGSRCGPRPDWHGTRLAVPARRDVVVLDGSASTWKPVLRLSGAHADQVLIVRWSPNGRYLATVGTATSSEIRIWNTSTKTCVAERPSPIPIWALEWSPLENSVSLLSEAGELIIWDEPVPRDLPHPALAATTEDGEYDVQADGALANERVTTGETVPSVKKASRNMTLNMDEDEEEDEEVEDDDDADQVDDRCRSRFGQRKRRRLINCDDFDHDEDDDPDGRRYEGDDTVSGSSGTCSRSSGSQDRYHRRSALQPPFQPGSTRGGDSWLMTWNLIGHIESSAVLDGVTRRLQISFADIDSRPRIRLTDRFGYNKAVLGKYSALFSSPSRAADNVQATVFYRTFDSWAANSDWSVMLPDGEDVTGIALCGRNVAVCSDKGLLRFLTHSGLHERVVYLDHDLVCVVGACEQPYLATILTSAPGQYHYALYQFNHEIVQMAFGPCPLTRTSTLLWAGFSEEGVLLVMDSTMSVRGLVPDRPGGSSSSVYQWVPILEGAAHCAASESGTTIWPVGASSTDLLVATLRNGVTEPNLANRPILNGLPFTIPVLLWKDSQVVALEQRSLLNQVALARLDAVSHLGSGRQRREYRQSALRLRNEQDGVLVRLISLAIDENNLSRALDLSTHISSEKAMDAARRIVQIAQQPQLLERLDLLAKAMFPKTSQVSVPAAESTNPGAVNNTALSCSEPAPIPSVASDTREEVPGPERSSTPSVSQSMKPVFRRPVPSGTLTGSGRSSSGFSSQLDQRRLTGGSLSSSRPF